MYNNIIQRITLMEEYMDTVSKAFYISPTFLINDSNLRIKLQLLRSYYEDGLWLSDYECDERGELPPDLKRGVLSQDALYNLLSDIEAFYKGGDLL